MVTGGSSHTQNLALKTLYSFFLICSSCGLVSLNRAGSLTSVTFSEAFLATASAVSFPFTVTQIGNHASPMGYPD
jgi:hypothetical protein